MRPDNCKIDTMFSDKGERAHKLRCDYCNACSNFNCTDMYNEVEAKTKETFKMLELESGLTDSSATKKLIDRKAQRQCYNCKHRDVYNNRLKALKLRLKQWQDFIFCKEFKSDQRSNTAATCDRYALDTPANIKKYLKNTENDLNHQDQKAATNSSAGGTKSTVHMINSLTPAIKELERAYKHFNAELFNNDLTDDVLITIQTKGRRNALGWYATNRWVKQGAAIHEINLSAEHLIMDDKGGKLLYEVLIHEMGHHWNNIRDIRDCARTGQYHNKKFKVAAELVGLEVEKTEKYGYAFTKLGAVAQMALDSLKPDYSAFDCVRLAKQKKPTKKSNLVKWSCGCTNVWSKVKLSAECENCNNTFIES